MEFDDGRLRSDRGESDATSAWSPVELREGLYEITLASWDALSKGQPREQWHLEGAEADRVVFTSPSTPDLPEDQDLLVVTVGVVLVPDLTSVRARHSAFPDDSSPNSVEALCVSFRRIPQADLTVMKSDSRDPVMVGEVFEYRLEVVNLGPDVAVGVAITDRLPVEVTYLEDDSGCQHEGGATGGVVTCLVDRLEVDERVSIVISVRADMPTDAALNRVLVEALTEDPDESNNRDEEITELLPPLSVSVEKTNDANGDGVFTDRETLVVPPDHPGLGGDVSFRARITNTSTVDVTLESLIDSFESPDGPIDLAVCEDLIGAILGAGESVECHFTIEDYRPARGASQTNTVTATVADVGRPDSTAMDADESVVDFVKILPTELALHVVKTNDADGDGVFMDQETVQISPAAPLRADVTFRAVVTNPNEVEVVLESLTDTFGTTTIDVCPSLIGSVLAPGASVVCTFTIEGYEPVSGLSQVNTVLAEVAQLDDPDQTAIAQDLSTVVFVRAAEAATTTTPETLPFTGPDTRTVWGFGVALLALGLMVAGVARGPRPRSIRSTDWLRD